MASARILCKYVYHLGWEVRGAAQEVLGDRFVRAESRGFETISEDDPVLAAAMEACGGWVKRLLAAGFTCPSNKDPVAAVHDVGALMATAKALPCPHEDCCPYDEVVEIKFLSPSSVEGSLCVHLSRILRPVDWSDACECIDDSSADLTRRVLCACPK
jgi:hypothetical protein